MTETYSYPYNFSHWSSIYSKELQLHAQMFTDLAHALGHEDMHALSTTAEDHVKCVALLEEHIEELKLQLDEKDYDLTQLRDELAERSR